MFIRSVAAAAALTAVLTACGGGTSRHQPTQGPSKSVLPALAVVVGNHANSPSGITNADAYLAGAVAAQGRVTVIEIDGKPRQIAIAELASQAHNSTARALEIKRLTGELNLALSSATPRFGQDDLLTGIDLAGRWLSGQQSRHLVIRDSGLQTTGLLHFQQPGMLQAAPDDVVAEVRRAGDLPQLAGVQVTLVGFGDVAAPQLPLDTAQRNNLIAIWSAILTAAGARVAVDSLPQTGAGPTSAPAVSVVPVPSAVLKPPPCDHPTPIAPTPIPASAYFVGNEATLLDPAKAADDLRPLARYATRTGATIHLTGTTARVGPKPGQISLSRQRAARLRDLLRTLGVPAGQLAAPAGVGSYWPGYTADHDWSGALISAAAALNRTVIVAVALPIGPSVTTC